MSSTAIRSDLQDVFHVGTHCQLESCNLNDYLAAVCPSCKGTFCNDHRTEAAHSCAKAGAWGEAKRQQALATKSIGADRPLVDRIPPGTCAKEKCKMVVGGSLHASDECRRCHLFYCVPHRQPDKHDCKIEENTDTAETTSNLQKATQSALSKLRVWTKAKKAEAGRILPKPKPSSAAARVVAVNKLKKSAKGDLKLAPEKRIYVYVEAEAETTTAKFPKGQFFYSADWVVGRVLDAAAKSLQVQNVNNQSSDERDKLRVFHVEGGRVLEFSEKFGKTVQSGNTVVLLRGVGGPQDLVEV